MKLANMSLGFLPLMFSIALYGIAPLYLTLGAGVAFGIAQYITFLVINKRMFLHHILEIVTLTLFVSLVACFASGRLRSFVEPILPFALEVAVFIPLLCVYILKKHSPVIPKAASSEYLHFRIQSKALTLSCFRIYALLVGLHSTVVLIGALLGGFNHPLFIRIVCDIVPFFIFLTCIVIGAIEVRILRAEIPLEFVPILNGHGEVIGRIDKQMAASISEAPYTYPIVRIAVFCNGMLLLAARRSTELLDKDKIDIPFETYLLVNEKPDEAVNRMLNTALPNRCHDKHPDFSIKYRFVNAEADRLVYLYVIDLGTDDSICRSQMLAQGKLWGFRQIEDNLGKDYFSMMLENEFDHLKMINETREIYKGF